METITQEELEQELPSYADMVEILNRVKGKISGSEQYKIENILNVLKQAAILTVAEYSDTETSAIEQINDILR